ncbi:unnamed protein product [Dracunculus medinensis]|uniref:Secreted protein n=1 Tax=Dracunculus medinensis TaxID=318479 RepID=A0A0N4UG55_DRAME|nr:unnamed protein product [Dracunculus medinensis]
MASESDAPMENAFFILLMSMNLLLLIRASGNENIWSRETLRITNTTARLIDGIFSYQGAETGILHGLDRYDSSQNSHKIDNLQDITSRKIF